MPYDYQTERPKLFTDEGQRMFLLIRDNVHHLLKLAGAVRAEEAIKCATGCTWLMLACLDRLVELEEITPMGSRDGVCAQYHVYTGPIRAPRIPR